MKSSIKEFKNKYSRTISNGVYYLSSPAHDNSFEELYLKIRDAEGRIYDDETVSKLPEVNRSHVHYKEWMVRKNSSEKLIKYISGLENELNIIELGCGNGWLSNKISEMGKTNVIGADVNEHELKQAARVFGNKNNLVFVYANIFDSKLNEMKFDIIILASALMYFKDVNALIDKLIGILNSGGEIHIIDNPFYSEQNAASARERALEHYKKMGVPEMAELVHPHLLSALNKCNAKILYNPGTFVNKLGRKLGKPVSPFFWIKIVK
jgi:ubiquinone/menaquinone biosynthesis C-methylase UbiE